MSVDLADKAGDETSRERVSYPSGVRRRLIKGTVAAAGGIGAATYVQPRLQPLGIPVVRAVSPFPSTTPVVAQIPSASPTPTSTPISTATQEVTSTTTSTPSGEAPSATPTRTATPTDAASTSTNTPTSSPSPSPTNAPEQRTEQQGPPEQPSGAGGGENVPVPSASPTATRTATPTSAPSARAQATASPTLPPTAVAQVAVERAEQPGAPQEIVELVSLGRSPLQGGGGPGEAVLLPEQPRVSPQQPARALGVTQLPVTGFGALGLKGLDGLALASAAAVIVGASLTRRGRKHPPAQTQEAETEQSNADAGEGDASQVTEATPPEGLE